MTASQATIGYGSKLAISTDGGSTYTDIGEVSDITPPSATFDTVDVTHMRSPDATREFALGLNDPGEMSFTINFVPGGDTDTFLRTIRSARQVNTARITYPNGITETFLALLTKYQPTVPTDGKMTATVSFKVTGFSDIDSESAPTNTVLPAIAGVQQNTHVLTALEGVWTGSPSFTYQWKRDASNISGATGRTYTAQVADETHALTVVVTGSNSAGSASATSGPTGAIAS